MEPQNQGSEPQFSGEIMKTPAGVPATETAGTPVNRGPLFGVIIGLLFVALVLVLGGLMFWNYLLTPTPLTIDPPSPDTGMNQEPESTTAQAQADAAITLSTSNELPAIEADLLSTDLSSLETELTAIDLMIESAGNATTTAP